MSAARVVRRMTWLCSILFACAPTEGGKAPPTASAVEASHGLAPDPAEHGKAPASPGIGGSSHRLAHAVRVGSPIGQARLTVFPLYLAAEDLHPAEDYLTLDEGVKQGTVQILEVTDPRGQDRSQVASLRVVNQSGKKLFLMAGEIVQGGKQDRILGKDLVLASGPAPCDVPVFCVEQGRWSVDAQLAVNEHGARAETRLGFVPARSMAAPAVKAAAQNGESQQSVWSAVANALALLGSASSSRTVSSASSYRNAFESKRAQEEVEPLVAQIAAALAKDPKVAGLAAAVDGKLVVADLFQSPGLFTRLREKLVRSYAVHAVAATEAAAKGPADPPGPDEVLTFLRAATDARATRRDVGAGAGKGEVFSVDDVQGAVHSGDGGEVHVNVMRR
jgi:hypothetical protein